MLANGRIRVLAVVLAVLVIGAVAGLFLTGLVGQRLGARQGSAAPPRWAGLQKYKRRCQELNRRGALARVLYQARSEMTRGESATITATATLNETLPRETVLHIARPNGEIGEESGVVVSCRLEARLIASQYQFEVSPKNWVDRSLLTTDTARWSWYVTPKVGGVHTLVLELRPILRLLGESLTTGPAGATSAEAANVQEYETTVHVSVPWTERPQETMSRLAATFKVAEGLVTAVSAFVVALAGLGAALGIRKIKRKRRGPKPDQV